jgi:DNA-binding transcriptional LysR family regulator
MDLKQLKILQAIAETGSFHGAADKLHLTQPAISHQLKSLELELGETLVMRSRPRVALLPAGVAVLAAAERVHAELQELKLRFAPETPGHPLTGVLRIAASTLGIVYLYGDLLERFIGQYPQIELVVTAAESGIGAARHVLAGSADVAFTPFPVNLPNLQTMALAETEHVVIVSRRHRLATRKRVSVNELRKHPFIRYQADAGSRAVSDQLFLPGGGYPPIFIESNDTEFIKRVVLLGMGSAMVPAFTVTDEGRDRRLVALTVQGTPAPQAFGLVWRRDVRMRTLGIFQEFCLQQRTSVGSGRAPATGRSAARRSAAAGTARNQPSVKRSRRAG